MRRDVLNDQIQQRAGQHGRASLVQQELMQSVDYQIVSDKIQNTGNELREIFLMRWLCVSDTNTLPSLSTQTPLTNEHRLNG